MTDTGVTTVKKNLKLRSLSVDILIYYRSKDNQTLADIVLSCVTTGGDVDNG
jgi:hypothetical protein